MRSRRPTLNRRAGGQDAGFTLVEVLIALSLLMVLGAVVLTSLVATTQSSRSTRTHHDLNEEARNALNRMARELRQADAITHVVNADGAAYDPSALVAVSLTADFNRDGCTGNAPTCTTDASNPEEITYCFDPAATAESTRDSLWLIPNGTPPTITCAVPGSQPILAGRVDGLRFEYRSNAYLYDTSPTDGVTTWQELDAGGPPVGDMGSSDGDINTSAVDHVNSVVVHLTMGADGVTQDYQTQVDLRNGS